MGLKPFTWFHLWPRPEIVISMMSVQHGSCATCAQVYEAAQIWIAAPGCAARVSSMVPTSSSEVLEAIYMVSCLAKARLAPA